MNALLFLKQLICIKKSDQNEEALINKCDTISFMKITKFILKRYQFAKS